MQKVTYTIYVSNDRVKYLVEKLGDSIVQKSADNQSTEVEITISSSLDLLLIFHAGIYAGRDKVEELYKTLAL